MSFNYSQIQEEQNIYPSNIQPAFKQSTTTELPQQSYSSQNVNSPMNPITLQHSSWVTPICSEPLLTLVLNFVIPGLGHVVLGQIKKGIFMMVLFFISEFFMILIITLTGGIGLILLPLLFIHWCIILMDGQLLASRLKNNVPIMHGECGTVLVKPGLSWVLSPEPVFSNSRFEELPSEWILKMQSLQQSSQ
jgi:hypothetical protein